MLQFGRIIAIAVIAAGLVSESACAGRDFSPMPRAPLPPAAVSPGAPVPAPPRPDFATWLAAFEQRALAAGISARTIDRAFAGVTYVPRVIELDQRQPEVKLGFGDYISRVVSEERIEAGQAHMIEDTWLLTSVSRRYGVQPAYITALWGMETEYGSLIGNFSTISALATLAYDGRRAPLFSAQLIDALKIIDRFGLPPEQLRGSWAGAMGQTQFMPLSFLRFAVSYSGTGAPDIWTNKGDVLASIANYLSKSGWDPRDGWGLEVTLPLGFDTGLIGNISGGAEKPGADWQALGIRALDGSDLPEFHGVLSLVQPGGPGGPTLLVTGNYRVLLNWNRSLYFATAVSFLADRIDN